MKPECKDKSKSSVLVELYDTLYIQEAIVNVFGFLKTPKMQNGVHSPISIHIDEYPRQINDMNKYPCASKTIHY